MDITVTPIRIPLERRKTDPLPDVFIPSRGRAGMDGIDEVDTEDGELRTDQETPFSDVTSVGGESLPEMTSPEAVYGIMPRMAWMYRLMERAGVSSRSARAMSWYESEKDAYQHHADYLKRLSKLREELIQQEQNNLANALDRLRMRSYGREFVYSRPGQEKKLRNRHSANPETVSQRKSLLTTFEQFQRMRPKKKPPLIMPLEGKSLIDTPTPLTDRHERQVHTERQMSTNHHERETTASSSVDESVRANLQRLGGQNYPSIPRQRRAQHKDIFVESSSYRRNSNNDSNNASSSEDRVAKMQKVNQKMMRMRNEARDADRVKLAPDSFRLTINDEDKMNLEQLEKYYCVYYIPPSSSPTTEDEPSVQLPSIASNGSHVTNGEKNGRIQKNGKIGYKVTSDLPIPPNVCNCACRMYVSGNKVESGMDQLDYAIQKTQSANDTGCAEGQRKNGYANHKTSSRGGGEKSTHHHHIPNENCYRGPPDSAERKKIRIDMPSIVYNTVHTPEPAVTSDSGPVLTKAFKQKELRQKELSNLMEDVKELNKITDDLTGSASND